MSRNTPTLVQSLLSKGRYVICTKKLWRVHHTILCTWSSWFTKAFLLTTRYDGQTNVVNLHNQMPEDVETLLRFIYSGSLDKSTKRTSRTYVELYNLRITFYLTVLVSRSSPHNANDELFAAMFKLMLGENRSGRISDAEEVKNVCIGFNHSRKMQHPDRCERWEEVFDECQVSKALYHPLRPAVLRTGFRTTTTTARTYHPRRHPDLGLGAR
ncbi:hypothetical protein B0H66DRAFT_608504 [Apodospora peruviana]|uniref:BTB domain-containing protein n=1 Tax=Apodospora peruviana TaxID=516989 RepID=A0AAE0HTA6_9PEZI|nr:hypothetical protein B0H66DRAFT_608504 [Apodospora peruviana]